MHASSQPVRVRGLALLLLLVGLAVLRSHVGTQRDGFTIDEPWHVVAGVSYLRTGDFRLNPEHPPLVKLVAGAAQDRDFVLPPLPPLAEKSQEREWVEDVTFLQNDAAAVQQASRLALWTFHGGLLLALGLMLWRALGLAWASGTLAFLAIEPSVAAHLPVVMTDLPLALGLVVAAVAAGLMLEGWRWRWVLVTGLALGLVLATKHSALAGLAGLALVVAAGAVAGWRQGRLREVVRRLGKAAAAGALALAVLWTTYGFQFHAGPDGQDRFNRAMADKVADLHIPHWRAGIRFADEWRLLPRAYLWGLADTVRAGVEGRGQATHFVWGVTHKGAPPWFTWPSIIVSKVPLALMAMALAGLALLPWAGQGRAGRWTLLAALGVGALHLAALMSGQGTYGGVRHALPIVVLLALPAGAVVSAAWSRRTALRMAAVAPLLLAGVMTAREPRLWEYHNALAGGTANAYRNFGNEGLDLGQRWPEIHRFYQKTIAPEGAVFYSSYGFMEAQARATKANYRRKVEDIRDDNFAGIYEGYFIYNMADTLPWPDYGWNPERELRGLTPVKRLGNAIIYRGRQESPLARAGNVYFLLMQHLYVKGGGDDEVVARRLQEVLDVMPYHAGAAIELGNARLRLGDPDGALAAYSTPLGQSALPPEPLIKAQLEARVAELKDPAVAWQNLPPLRNPSME
ncbi:phospholipid carrier-dependent glycosyltransferase [Arenimonas aestuarii]